MFYAQSTITVISGHCNFEKNKHFTAKTTCFGSFVTLVSEVGGGEWRSGGERKREKGVLQ